MKEESITMEETMQSRFNGPELVPELPDISAALFKATSNGSVPPATIGLVRMCACQITGNTYTLIRQAREVRKLGESEDRIDALASWQDAPYFTDAERAALALTEAVLQPSKVGEEKVPDQLYAHAAEHYDPKAIATLAIAIGQAMFFMPVALIGRPLPGMPPSQTWT